MDEEFFTSKNHNFKSFKQNSSKIIKPGYYPKSWKYFKKILSKKKIKKIDSNNNLSYNNNNNIFTNDVRFESNKSTENFIKEFQKSLDKKTSTSSLENSKDSKLINNFLIDTNEIYSNDKLNNNNLNDIQSMSYTDIFLKPSNKITSTPKRQRTESNECLNELEFFQSEKIRIELKSPDLFADEEDVQNQYEKFEERNIVESPDIFAEEQDQSVEFAERNISESPNIFAEKEQNQSVGFDERKIVESPDIFAEKLQNQSEILGERIITKSPNIFAYDEDLRNQSEILVERITSKSPNIFAYDEDLRNQSKILIERITTKSPNIFADNEDLRNQSEILIERINENSPNIFENLIENNQSEKLFDRQIDLCEHEENLNHSEIYVERFYSISPPSAIFQNEKHQKTQSSIKDDQIIKNPDITEYQKSQTEIIIDQSITRKNYQIIDSNIISNNENQSQMSGTSKCRWNNSIYQNICLLESNNSNKSKNLNPSNAPTTEYLPQNFNLSFNINHNFINNNSTNNFHNNTALSIDESILVNRKKFMMQKIENLIKSLINDSMNNRKQGMIFKIQRSSKWSDCMFVNNVVTIKNAKEGHRKLVRFMSNTSEHHFTVIVYLLSEIYKLLNTNSSSTKRELYYVRTELFQSQMCINLALKDICSLLHVYPWELGIHSSSKGTICGDISIQTTDDYIINCKNIPGGYTIMNDITKIKKIETQAKFLLIVEKDAVFKRLLDDKIFDKLGCQLVLLTAKGYPDINTRYLLKKIWDEFHLPIYALVDADPHGIEIMCTYKYGSMSMSSHSDVLAVPAIRWLGVYPSDIETLCLPVSPMTTEDHKKIISLLKRPYANGKLLDELNILARIDEKSEIESLSCLSRDYLLNIYLPRKIENDLRMTRELLEQD